MVTPRDAQAVSAHYTSGTLADTILTGLRAAGKDPDALQVDDLAPIDQFHMGGKPATLALMQRAGLRSGMRVLDVGGGLGGPARTIATQADCTVTVLDLSEEFCRVGEMLTARTGLGARVTFQHGNALALPFADGSFDVVWTQHSTMNIEDKERLCAEIYRVLRPHGRYALHEAMAGPVQPIHFPVPWADAPTISFLRPPAEVRALLVNMGFAELSWEDTSAHALPPPGAPTGSVASPAPIGLHLLMENFAEKMRNLRRNRDERRIAVIQAVFERS